MATRTLKESFPRFYVQVSLDEPVVREHVDQLAKYDIITAGSRDDEVSRTAIKKIKSLNPEAVILRYLNLTDLPQGSPELYDIQTNHPDWLLRDKKGNPCRAYNLDKGRGLHSGTRWAMDPRSDWRKFYARCALEIMELGYNGIFADNTWKYYNWEANYWELDMTNDGWIQAWAEFFGYVKAQLGYKLLICNGDPEEKYLVNSDGDMLESFMRLDIRNFEEELEKAKLVSETGKISITYSYYCNEMITKTNLFHWYYTCSLLTNGYFCYATTFDYWHPEYEIKLGEAKGEYYQRDGVYQRDFERGKVIVNPTLKDFRVKLEDEFRLWGKERVKEIRLPAHTGVLLQAL